MYEGINSPAESSIEPTPQNFLEDLGKEIDVQKEFITVLYKRLQPVSDSQTAIIENIGENKKTMSEIPHIRSIIEDLRKNTGKIYQMLNELKI